MDTKKEIKTLINFLRVRAEAERKNASKNISNYMEGLCRGYASAYELCIEWLNDILCEEE